MFYVAQCAIEHLYLGNAALGSDIRFKPWVALKQFGVPAEYR